MKATIIFVILFIVEVLNGNIYTGLNMHASIKRGHTVVKSPSKIHCAVMCFLDPDCDLVYHDGQVKMCSLGRWYGIVLKLGGTSAEDVVLVKPGGVPFVVVSTYFSYSDAIQICIDLGGNIATESEAVSVGIAGGVHHCACAWVQEQKKIAITQRKVQGHCWNGITYCSGGADSKGGVYCVF